MYPTALIIATSFTRSYLERTIHVDASKPVQIKQVPPCCDCGEMGLTGLERGIDSDMQPQDRDIVIHIDREIDTSDGYHIKLRK